MHPYLVPSTVQQFARLFISGGFGNGRAYLIMVPLLDYGSRGPGDINLLYRLLGQRTILNGPVSRCHAALDDSSQLEVMHG